MHTANNVIAPAAFLRPMTDHPSLHRRSPTTPAGQYNLSAVARRLGLLHYTPRTIIAKIRALVEHDGFPMPVTVRVRACRRVHGAGAVTQQSVWHAADVNAWIDRDMPPAAALQREDRAMLHTRHVMDGRAQLLVVANR